MTMPLIKLVLGLLGVVAAVLLFSKILPRLGGFSPSRHERFRLLASVAVGEKERVALMQIGERQIAIGVAPGRVTALHVLEEPVEIEGSTNHPQVSLPRNWLGRVLTGRRS